MKLHRLDYSREETVVKHCEVLFLVLVLFITGCAGERTSEQNIEGGTSMTSHPIEANNTHRSTKEIAELYIDITTNEPLPDEGMVITKNSGFVYRFRENMLFYSPDEALFIGVPDNKQLEQTHSFKLTMEESQKKKILSALEQSGLLSEAKVKLPGLEKGHNEIGVILQFEDGSVNKYWGSELDEPIMTILGCAEAEIPGFPEQLLQQREGTTDIGYLIRGDFDMMQVYETFDSRNLKKILLFKVNSAALPLPEYPRYMSEPQTTILIDYDTGYAYAEQEKNIISNYEQSTLRISLDEMKKGKISQLINECKLDMGQRFAYTESGFILPTMFIEYPYWAFAMENSDGEIAYFSGDGIGLGMPQSFMNTYNGFVEVLGLS